MLALPRQISARILSLTSAFKKELFPGHLVILTACLFSCPSLGAAAEEHPKYTSDQIIVKPLNLDSIGALHSEIGGEAIRTYSRFGNIQVIRIPPP